MAKKTKAAKASAGAAVTVYLRFRGGPRSGKSSGAAPGVVSWPWRMTKPPAPILAASLPAEATMIVPLLRA